MTATPSFVKLTSVNHARLPPMTLADAELILATWTDLRPGRAQKMRTALSTAAKALAPCEHPKTAATVVALDCLSLNRLLRSPPSTFGLSPGRMTSLCSELRYILRRLGRHEPDRRGTSLSPFLQACLDRLPPHRRLAIMDFLRFLDDTDIDPGKVDAGTLAAFQQRCSERILCGNPVVRAGYVAATWNWSCQNVPNWPGMPIKRTGRADHYTLPIETYPASFQQDLDEYTRWLSGADIEHIFSEDLFSEEGGRRPRKALRPSSIEGLRFILRCAAAALVSKGVDQQSITELRDLVTPPEHPKDIIRYYYERSGNKISPMTERVSQTLHLLARDYCRLPESEAQALANWAKRMAQPEPIGLTEKNTRRLRVLMQPRVRAMLLCFPAEFMRRAASPSLKPAVAARLAMYAVAMEILLICPMRRGNLAALRLDQHLHRPDPRSRRPTHIIIEAGEVKNENAIHWPIPPETGALIETYLTRHRSHLVDPGNPYLFGIGDKQRAGQFLGSALAKIITRETGAGFNVHLARHFAAWNFLQQNPGQYEVIRQVLGHRNIRVTMAYYVGLEAAAAARHFDQTILRERRTVRTVAARAFRSGTGGLSGEGGRL